MLLFLAFPLTIIIAKNTSTNDVLPPPLYVVDGSPTDPSELPEIEDIYSTTVLNSETGKQLYGERGSNVVFVITTKQAKGLKIASTKEENRGDETRCDSNIPKRQKKGTPGKLGRWLNKVTGGKTFLGIILSLVIVLAIMAMPTIVSILLRRKNPKKSNKRGFSNNDPGIFDSDGVRFEAVKQLKNYFLPIFCLFIITMYGIILYIAITGTPSTGLLLIILIFVGGLSILFTLIFVNSCKQLRSYLIIDEKGIRGYVGNTERLNLNLDLKEIDISWEQIKRAQMDGYLVTFLKRGTKIPDEMVDFAELADTDITEEEIESSIYQIDLSLFPINKVKDCINYFYGRTNGIAKQPSLIKSDSSEKTNVLTIILVILAALLLSYLAQ